MMTAKKITADEALTLASTFREASGRVGDYLYENWTSIPSKNRDTLRSLEVTLLNLATDLVTQAAGVILDDAQASLAQLSAATQTAKKALTKIQEVKKAINIATALISLAAAIPTGNVISIVSAMNGVLEAAKGKATATVAAASKNSNSPAATTSKSSANAAGI